MGKCMGKFPRESTYLNRARRVVWKANPQAFFCTEASSADARKVSFADVFSRDGVFAVRAWLTCPKVATADSSDFMDFIGSERAVNITAVGDFVEQVAGPELHSWRARS